MSPGDAAGPALSLARVLAVLGSARADSHTAALLDAVLAGRVVTRIDLRTLDVRPYEYDAPIERDDFAGVVEAMLAHDVILFATPVYWYAMSGRMKTLFDRLSDLVTCARISDAA
jgi:multimeric flavodoxin WrbA